MQRNFDDYVRKLQLRPNGRDLRNVFGFELYTRDAAYPFDVEKRPRPVVERGRKIYISDNVRPTTFLPLWSPR